MTVRILSFDDPKEFFARAGSFLMRNEAEHCLPIGVILTGIKQPDLYGEPFILLAAARHGEIVGVSMRPPGYEPLLSRLDDERAIPGFVDAYLERESIPGVLGPNHVSER